MPDTCFSWISEYNKIDNFVYITAIRFFFLANWRFGLLHQWSAWQKVVETCQFGFSASPNYWLSSWHANRSSIAWFIGIRYNLNQPELIGINRSYWTSVCKINGGILTQKTANRIKNLRRVTFHAIEIKIQGFAVVKNKTRVRLKLTCESCSVSTTMISPFVIFNSRAVS